MKGHDVAEQWEPAEGMAEAEVGAMWEQEMCQVLVRMHPSRVVVVMQEQGTMVFEEHRAVVGWNTGADEEYLKELAAAVGRNRNRVVMAAQALLAVACQNTEAAVVEQQRVFAVAGQDTMLAEEHSKEAVGRRNWGKILVVD